MIKVQTPKPDVQGLHASHILRLGALGHAASLSALHRSSAWNSSTVSECLPLPSAFRHCEGRWPGNTRVFCAQAQCLACGCSVLATSEQHECCPSAKPLLCPQLQIPCEHLPDGHYALPAWDHIFLCPCVLLFIDHKLIGEQISLLVSHPSGVPVRAPYS